MFFGGGGGGEEGVCGLGTLGFCRWIVAYVPAISDARVCLLSSRRYRKRLRDPLILLY